MELFDWQKPIKDAAVASLKKNRVFICGAYTGSGKTPISCAVIKELGCPALVIAPKVSLTQWERTAEAMGVKDQMVGIINPEQLSKPSGCVFFNRDTGWKLPPNCLVVFDEIHRGASGEDSITTKAVAYLHALPTSKLLALSATVADSPLKLRALGYWLGFHNFTIANFHNWCQRHGCSWQVFGWGRNKRRVFEFTKAKSRAKELMGIIRREMGERFKSIGPDEIPNFPDEILEVKRIDLAKEDHDALVEAYASMPDAMKTPTKDDMVRLLRDRQKAEFCKAQAIAELAVEYEEDGLSVFILLNFTDARLRVEEFLKSKGIKFASIYGGQKDAERQKGIDAFQRNDVHILVAMAAAASCALSAHDERHERPRVSLISPGYNAAEVKQGLGRIRRVNGTAVTQYFILAANSVEEKVATSLQRKLESIDAINDNDLMR